jgi:RimJ/RimL family protein N-acetyltransferase
MEETSHRTSDLQPELAPPSGIRLRAVEPSDRDGVAALFDRLSPQSRHRRFLTPKPALSARELTYLTEVDHRRHEALAAIDQRDGSIVGLASYAGWVGRANAAEAAVVVADDHQRRGIGIALVGSLIDLARLNGFDVLTATTLWENRPARALLRRLGFHARASEGTIFELELGL